MTSHALGESPQQEVGAATEDRASRLYTSAKAGAIAASVYFLVLFLVFGAWVHYYYAGEYSGPLMISTLFGVSEKSVAAGAQPIYEAPVAGWDGQFYYTQSNDPLLLADYSHSTLFDSLSYRFQRNGLPILAWAASFVTGHDATTPLIYFVTQLTIMSLGFGTLVAFLVNRRLHWAWAIVWGCYGGLLRPFAHGLPDPTADSLLLLAILAALGGRLWIYALVCSLLCLCRESYAAPAAVIWLLTLLNKLDWNRSVPYSLRVAVTAIPGAAVLGWAYYVAIQTDSGLLAGSRSIPWGGLVDWPFKAYVQCLWLDIKASDENDAIYATSCAVCLLSVLVVIVGRLRTSPIAWAILPHVLLMSMTGWIVWEAGVGFFKNTSSVVMLGVLLLSLTPSRILRGALLFTFLASLHYLYLVDYRHQTFLPPVVSNQLHSPDHTRLELTPVEDEIEYSSRVELVSEGAPVDNYRGIFRWFHRFPAEYTVRVTNTSRITWPASLPGTGAAALGRQFLHREAVLHEDRVALYKTLNPGDALDIRFMLPTRTAVSRTRRVRVGMIVDGDAWFFWHDPQQKIDIPY